MYWTFISLPFLPQTHYYPFLFGCAHWARVAHLVRCSPLHCPPCAHMGIYVFGIYGLVGNDILSSPVYSFFTPRWLRQLSHGLVSPLSSALPVGFAFDFCARSIVLLLRVISLSYRNARCRLYHRLCSIGLCL
ncbi:hypothetical protein EDB89DRAFT_594993 [Lactarius sanguifluus]|nr:hypothetical protein EDB89DRAFT_594993 [Lactarius sanguifluus]